MVFKRRDKPPLLTRIREVVYPKRGWRRGIEYLGHRVRRLPDTPHRIALGISCGVFVSFTPFFGIHILAAAGLKRLGLEHVATDLMPLDSFPPAPGQGAICIESRIGDGDVERILMTIHDVPTGQALAAERACLEVLDGSCRTPIAGHATIANDMVSFAGLIISPDGTVSHEVKAQGPAQDAARIGEDAARTVRAKAGETFFDGWA